MAMVRRFLYIFLGLAVGASFSRAAETDLARYGTAEIAPARTSIYIGSVSMTFPVFIRKGGTYWSTYSARVFPYFFYNEHGHLSIDVSDDQLRQLARGETIEFKGRGLSSVSEERPIEGKVTPTDATSGKIKVRVYVSKHIQLIFNTTYRLKPAAAVQ